MRAFHFFFSYLLAKDIFDILLDPVRNVLSKRIFQNIGVAKVGCEVVFQPFNFDLPVRLPTCHHVVDDKKGFCRANRYLEPIYLNEFQVCFVKVVGIPCSIRQYSKFRTDIEFCIERIGIGFARRIKVPCFFRRRLRMFVCL